MTLAERIGVSFQQIQKYESGVNSVSLEKLEKISDALRTPIVYFIAERKTKKEEKEPAISEKGGKYGEMEFEDLSAEELQLILQFRSIKNVNIKNGIKQLVRGASQL